MTFFASRLQKQAGGLFLDRHELASVHKRKCWRRTLARYRRVPATLGSQLTDFEGELELGVQTTVPPHPHTPIGFSNVVIALQLAPFKINKALNQARRLLLASKFICVLDIIVIRNLNFSILLRKGLSHRHCRGDSVL